MRKILTSKWTKAALFTVALLPFIDLVVRVFTSNLGPNPVEFVQHATGDWTIRFIVFTLAITPLRKSLNLPELIRFRRMLGLFAFFYVCFHFLTYIGPDQSFSLAGMWKDVAKRPFITVGFLGFVLLIPLALTSTAGWIRRLGGKRWQMLHRAIYLTAICGVIHYYWLVKSDVRAPLFYGALVALLLLWRVADWFFKRRRASAPARAVEQRASARI
ncbi:MAG TPA: protein-methionine-sulfoxide reductase heme-binding subunit MsrQ [Candidatus Acidoferrales bacterium]|nr:protein-methionine-sulfoxide reductase heme-binding subunit MsrQ [Candidatus Acidoferrales bacterium]